MEEFGQFNERDEVEIVSGIPSGIIRKGLFFFFLTIASLLILSCFIKVKRSVPIETKILADKPVQIKVTPFGSYENSTPDTGLTDTLNKLNINKPGIKNDGKSNVNDVVIVKRNFQTMHDSVFIIPANTNIKLFFSINDPVKNKRLAIGQNITIDYALLNCTVKGRILNTYNTADNGSIYELDVSKLAQTTKFKFLCYRNYLNNGQISSTQTTVFEQIYSNLFNKIKI
jgi:hypothetical protein